MTRLTPEREAEIRESAASSFLRDADWTCRIVDLLAEIDALRDVAELLEHQKRIEVHGLIIQPASQGPRKFWMVRSMVSDRCDEYPTALEAIRAVMQR